MSLHPCTYISWRLQRMVAVLPFLPSSYPVMPSILKGIQTCNKTHVPVPLGFTTGIGEQCGRRCIMLARNGRRASPLGVSRPFCRTQTQTRRVRYVVRYEDAVCTGLTFPRVRPALRYAAISAARAARLLRALCRPPLFPASHRVPLHCSTASSSIETPVRRKQRKRQQLHFSTIS